MKTPEGNKFGHPIGACGTPGCTGCNPNKATGAEVTADLSPAICYCDEADHDVCWGSAPNPDCECCQNTVDAAGAPTTGFDRGISNRDLADHLDDVMTTYGTSGEIHGEDGTYPGSVRIQGPYEGELLDLAEEFARNDLYVNLRDGQDVWGDPENGFEFTVSDNDRYGNHHTWMSKHDF